jgi:integrase
LDRCRETVKPRTLIQYTLACKRLKGILSEFTPEQVEPHHIASILDKFRSSPNAANRMLTFTRLAFANGLTWGMCRTNPSYGVKRHLEGKRDRLLTDTEYQAIWEAAPPQLRAIMDVCYRTGQRIGDVLAIRLSDISKDGICFTQEKTSKRLMVGMSAELADAVERAKGLHSNVRGLTLFHGRGGRPLSYYGVRSAFERACEKAKIEDATLHDIRAKAATDAKRQGRDATALLGHSTQATICYLRGREFVPVSGPSIGQVLDVLDKKQRK